MSTKAPAQPRNPNVVLAFLLLAYILNFLDRQILGILAQPIKADLQLTDTEFGAIGGLAFALLYSVMGVPLSFLADRTSRSRVIAGSLAVWSGFTALCGTATTYGQLFLCRLGVGVGEAGGVAPSYALIADYFPPEKRGRAMGIYSLGVPLGLGGGTLLGAYIAAWIDWRAAFLIMGLLGVVLAPIFLWVVRDVPRAELTGEAPADRVPLSRVFPLLMAKPSFWLLAFAASSSSLVGYGLALWTPSVLMRSFGLDLIGAGQFMGSLLLVGGTAGVFAGGLLADKLGRGDRRWFAWLPALAWLICTPFFLFGFTSSSLWLAWPLLLVPNALNILWLGPITTAVQHLVERPMRATASACFLFINNLIGLGVGPLLIGRVSEALKADYGVESLRYAAMGALVFYLVAALLALLAARRLRRDWVEDAATAVG
ncbi:MAG TPA: MFS transporter [Sphingomicrobium sp.]|jgi:predicted MFS family arabinose efflux permease|nr:MFS transporter [Sphingomicrobium sp.]